MEKNGAARLRASFIAFVATALLVATGAPATAKEESKIPDVPGDDIFGFAHSTDLGNAGDMTFVQEWDGRPGKRDGHYRASAAKSEFGYTFTDDWSINLSAFGAYHHIRAVTDLDDLGRGNFDGLSFELHRRLLKRSASNPFAITAAVEPRWARVDGASGLRSEAYGAEFKLAVDAVIVPEKIFWAANLVWAPQRAQDIETRAVWLTTSASVLSTALAFQLADKFFAGVEVRHLANYDAAWFEQRVGYAVYAGPTMLWKITDKLAFNATWQPQVAGRSVHNPDLRYDLDHFERAQFRFKLALQLN